MSTRPMIAILLSLALTGCQKGNEAKANAENRR
jgi:hypothetical protein